MNRGKSYVNFIQKKKCNFTAVIAVIALGKFSKFCKPSFLTDVIVDYNIPLKTEKLHFTENFTIHPYSLIAKICMNRGKSCANFIQKKNCNFTAVKAYYTLIKKSYH